MADYVLKQSDDLVRERERLTRIQALQDPPTERFLEATGVAEGWSCLDAGAGAGSITAWLARRVGPTGSVLATDLDVGLLREQESGHVTVSRHDIRHDPLPRGSFDLAHARLLLLHLPERDAVLQKLIESVREEGWVVVGDIDFSTVRISSPMPLFERTTQAFDQAVRGAGWDPSLGPRLPEMFDHHGLRGVEAESWQVYQEGGSAAPTLLAMTYRRLRPLLLATGKLTETDLDELQALLADPSIALFGPTIWTIRGQVRS